MVLHAGSMRVLMKTLRAQPDEPGLDLGLIGVGSCLLQLLFALAVARQAPAEMLMKGLLGLQALGVVLLCKVPFLPAGAPGFILGCLLLHASTGLWAAVGACACLSRAQPGHPLASAPCLLLLFHLARHLGSGVGAAVASWAGAGLGQAQLAGGLAVLVVASAAVHRPQTLAG
mmetsp:Transcript_105724/g.242111  ORF Transcript_105724/g.242111 Transcript_105724/m.242111 type:complete len:173 (+) Transcript_105724:3-521(+)